MSKWPALLQGLLASHLTSCLLQKAPGGLAGRALRRTNKKPEQKERDTWITEVRWQSSALLSELTKGASHQAACLLRPVLKADRRRLCLHRAFAQELKNG